MPRLTEPEKNRMIHDRGYMTSEERSEIWRILSVITEMNAREEQIEDDENYAINLSEEQIGEPVDLIELHNQIND
jgi:hypothetical protein